MILAHTIVGLMPIDNYQFSWYWLAGSIIPDVDHLFVIYKHKLFSSDKLIDAEKECEENVRKSCVRTLLRTETL